MCKVNGLDKVQADPRSFTSLHPLTCPHRMPVRSPCLSLFYGCPFCKSTSFSDTDNAHKVSQYRLYTVPTEVRCIAQKSEALDKPRRLLIEPCVRSVLRTFNQAHHARGKIVVEVTRERTRGSSYISPNLSQSQSPIAYSLRSPSPFPFS